MTRLYSFFNSSTSFRVRIALALKGLDYDCIPVNIRTGGHREADYVATVNPAAAVPVLSIDEGPHQLTLGQSLAIIDYLDTTFPDPRLIPSEAVLRARVMELSHLIACDIHPVNNLRVLRYLQDRLGVSAVQKNEWYKHWIAEGLSVAERLLVRSGGSRYCFGDSPTLADCCLIPQVANASRMGCDIEIYPTVNTIYRYAMTQPAFAAAAPERQPDHTP